MALVTLPHPPMVGFRENALAVRRFQHNEWDVQLKNEDGSALDLFGITVIQLSVYQKREVRGDRVHYVDERLRLEVGKGITVDVDPATGKIVVSTEPTQTEALDPGLYWYDLWYDDGSAVRQSLIDKAEFRLVE